MSKLDNPYYEEFMNESLQLNEFETRKLVKRSFASFSNFYRRSGLVNKYSWGIPSETAIREIRKYGPIVEIGAGTGYWAWLISQDGTRIYAYDDCPPGIKQNKYHQGVDGVWFPVETGSKEKISEHKDCTLFLCWTPYSNSMAYECLKEYEGKHFIFVGEGTGGCTGDEKFFEHLYENFKMISCVDIPQWFGIHDFLSVWERKD